MRQNIEAAGVTLCEAPIETLGAIGTVIRYHAPFRYSYEKIRKQMEREIAYKECVEMDFSL